MNQPARTETTAQHWVIGGEFLVAAALFALLWVLNTAYRQIYVPTGNDLTALVDGLLMLPGAHWEDWFTQGHSHFFDTYPEWPLNETPFSRPLFQFTIYLAHFFLEQNWAAYLSINYASVAGVAAMAFTIARRVAGLERSASVLTAALTVLSPSVSHFSIWEIGYASEALGAVLVGAAFLAVVSCRDTLCVALLSLALFTKETTVWAPFAALATVLLRSSDRGARPSRLCSAALMLLPLAIWVGFRLIFFGGIGGSYATAGYAQSADFLNRLAWKLTHVNRLLVSQAAIFTEGFPGAVDRVFMIVTYILIAVPLVLWICDSVRAAGRRLRDVWKGYQPTGDPILLISLWAAIGFSFYFALALTSVRYSASAVMFTWPAMMGVITRRQSAMLRAGLIACCLLTAPRALHLLEEWNGRTEGSSAARIFSSTASVDEALRRVPGRIDQIYVLSAGGLVSASPRYIGAFLGMSGEIVRIADIRASCEWTRFDALDHVEADGLVTITAKLPDCASFQFKLAGQGSATISGGRIVRNNSITYELPDARISAPADPLEPSLEIGHRMTVDIRLRGNTRFIIERGGPDGETVQFDEP